MNAVGRCEYAHALKELRPPYQGPPPQRRHNTEVYSSKSSAQADGHQVSKVSCASSEGVVQEKGKEGIVKTKNKEVVLQKEGLRVSRRTTAPRLRLVS